MPKSHLFCNGSKGNQWRHAVEIGLNYRFSRRMKALGLYSSGKHLLMRRISLVLGSCFQQLVYSKRGCRYCGIEEDSEKTSFVYEDGEGINHWRRSHSHGLEHYNRKYHHSLGLEIHQGNVKMNILPSA